MRLTNYARYAYFVRMKLRDWRLAKGLSMEQLGELIGLTQSSVSRIENGKNRPEWGTLDRIVEVTDGQVTPNDFTDLPPKDEQDVAA